MKQQPHSQSKTSSQRQAWRYRTILVLLCLLVAPVGVRADDSVRVFEEEGVASTGLNRLLGLPIWSYPNLEQFIPIFGDGVQFAGFNLAGEFNAQLGEGNGNSLPLTPFTPPDALLASHLDAFGLSLVGVDPINIPNEVLNIPVDDAAVLVDEAGVVREKVPCASETGNSLLRTRSAPCTEPVTLGRWLEASGKMKIKCFTDGLAEVKIAMKHLLPNRMYSIWYAAENLAAGPQFLIQAIPFGGVPNIVVTDSKGRATFGRTLGFCPHDQSQALGIAVVLRANGQNYGGVPVPLLNQENPLTAFDGYLGAVPGTVVNQQISFNINGVRVDPSELSGP